jgi:putative membrane protein
MRRRPWNSEPGDNFEMSSELHLGLHLSSVSIPVTLALSGLVLVYLRGMSRLRRALPNVLSSWQLAAFLSGLLSMWVAVGSGLAVLDHQFLTAHMVQHLLLMTVAAPLILLGAPVITLLNGLPPRFASGIPRLYLRWPAMQWFGRTLTHPVFCWLASTITVLAWHIPGVFEIGMQSKRWHIAEHVCFLVAGLLFWWPIVRPWPTLAEGTRWLGPLYLFLATLPCDALSAFLTFCNRIVYPHYLSVHPLFGLLPLADQAAAGALMWVWVTFVYLVPAGFVIMRVLSPQGSTSSATVS